MKSGLWLRLFFAVSILATGLGLGNNWQAACGLFLMLSVFERFAADRVIASQSRVINIMEAQRDGHNRGQ